MDGDDYLTTKTIILRHNINMQKIILDKIYLYATPKTRFKILSNDIYGYHLIENVHPPGKYKCIKSSFFFFRWYIIEVIMNFYKFLKN